MNEAQPPADFETLGDAMVAFTAQMEGRVTSLLYTFPTWGKLRELEKKGLDEKIESVFELHGGQGNFRVQLRQVLAGVLINNLCNALDEERSIMGDFPKDDDPYRKAIADTVRFVVVSLGILPENLETNPVVRLAPESSQPKEAVHPLGKEAPRGEPLMGQVTLMRAMELLLEHVPENVRAQCEGSMIFDLNKPGPDGSLGTMGEDTVKGRLHDFIAAVEKMEGLVGAFYYNVREGVDDPEDDELKDREETKLRLALIFLKALLYELKRHA